MRAFTFSLLIALFSTQLAHAQLDNFSTKLSLAPELRTNLNGFRQQGLGVNLDVHCGGHWGLFYHFGYGKAFLEGDEKEYNAFHGSAGVALGYGIAEFSLTTDVFTGDFALFIPTLIAAMIPEGIYYNFYPSSKTAISTRLMLLGYDYYIVNRVNDSGVTFGPSIKIEQSIFENWFAGLHVGTNHRYKKPAEPDVFVRLHLGYVF